MMMAPPNRLDEQESLLSSHMNEDDGKITQQDENNDIQVSIQAVEPSTPHAYHRFSLSRRYLNAFQVDPYVTLSTIPAMLVALLLNLLDAVSYGMLIFPTATQASLSHTGPLGVLMLLWCTGMTQGIFSLFSSFQHGVVASMMIEVIPFLRSMSTSIIASIAEELGQEPSALGEAQVLPTILMSYAIATLMTGLAFFLTAWFRLGDVVRYFPRHVLLGCIGGIGIFLLQTSIEVTAGVETDTVAGIKSLFTSEKLPLWISPIIIVIVIRFLCHLPSMFKATKKDEEDHDGYWWLPFGHPMFLPLLFLLLTPLFYLVALPFVGGDLDRLRSLGWLIHAPSDATDTSDRPFYQYYLYLFSFSSIHWSALVQVVPTIVSMAFFGLLHVPINVPSFSVSSGQVVSMQRELWVHGLANVVACVFGGALPTYFVYSNSLLYYRLGGRTRFSSGVLLTGLTFVLLVVGVVVVKFVPVILIGTLIIHLGIDLVEEAFITPFHRVQSRTEYGIIVIMGISMVVVGFLKGILLGCILALLAFAYSYAKIPLQIKVVQGSMEGEDGGRSHGMWREIFSAGPTLRSTWLPNALLPPTQPAVLMADPRRLTFMRRHMHRIMVVECTSEILSFANMGCFHEMLHVVYRKNETLTLEPVSLSEPYDDETRPCTPYGSDVNDSSCDAQDNSAAGRRFVLFDFSTIQSIDSTIIESFIQWRPENLILCFCGLQPYTRDALKRGGVLGDVSLGLPVLIDMVELEAGSSTMSSFVFADVAEGLLYCQGCILSQFDQDMDRDATFSHSSASNLSKFDLELPVPFLQETFKSYGQEYRPDEVRFTWEKYPAFTMLQEGARLDEYVLLVCAGWLQVTLLEIGCGRRVVRNVIFTTGSVLPFYASWYPQGFIVEHLQAITGVVVLKCLATDLSRAFHETLRQTMFDEISKSV